MTKTLAELQTRCRQHGIGVPPQRRAAKEPYLHALRDSVWAKENPDRPLREQIDLAKLGADAADLVKEGLTRLKGEREQLQGQLKDLDANKAPHDIVREQAAKFVTGWTDIGQLIDDADLAEQRVILQHLVHSLVLTAAGKGPSTAPMPCRCSRRSGRST